jgi:hypothetical protein
MDTTYYTRTEIRSAEMEHISTVAIRTMQCGPKAMVGFHALTLCEPDIPEFLFLEVL